MRQIFGEARKTWLIALGIAAILFITASYFYYNIRVDLSSDDLLKKVALYLETSFIFAPSILCIWLFFSLLSNPEKQISRVVKDDKKLAFLSIVIIVLFVDALSIQFVLRFRDGAYESLAGMVAGAIIMAFFFIFANALLVASFRTVFLQGGYRLVSDRTSNRIGEEYSGYLEIPFPAHKAPDVRAKLVMLLSVSDSVEFASIDSDVWSAELVLSSWTDGGRNKCRAKFTYHLDDKELLNIVCNGPHHPDHFLWEMRLTSMDSRTPFSGVLTPQITVTMFP